MDQEVRDRADSKASQHTQEDSANPSDVRMTFTLSHAFKAQPFSIQ